MLQSRGHDVLGDVVQPVRQFAAPGWPPRGEELVGSPTEQLSLGAQRLVEQDLGRFFATPLTDTTDPAAAPEALRAGRVLNDSVERDVLADDDLSHSGSPFTVVLSYYRGPAKAHLADRSLKSCLTSPAWLGLPSRASYLAGSRQSRALAWFAAAFLALGIWVNLNDLGNLFSRILVGVPTPQSSLIVPGAILLLGVVGSGWRGSSGGEPPCPRPRRSRSPAEPVGLATPPSGGGQDRGGSDLGS